MKTKTLLIVMSGTKLLDCSLPSVAMSIVFTKQKRGKYQEITKGPIIKFQT